MKKKMTKYKIYFYFNSLFYLAIYNLYKVYNSIDIDINNLKSQ